MCHIVIRKPPPEEPVEPERKERVIHTRVPESLETELRQKAQDLGISVSNLVRNVLGHAFGLIGDVVVDGHAIARAARGDKPASGSAAPTSQAEATAPRGAAASPSPSPSPSIDDVLGWQPMILGKNAVCVRCNAMLPRGSDAATGIAETTGGRFVICLVCLEQLRV
jgi:hypothetical protein